MVKNLLDGDPIETREWLDAFASLLAASGPDRARFVAEQLFEAALQAGVALAGVEGATGHLLQTPCRNTIPPSAEPDYPGDLALEARIEAINRWNAMVMVLRAKKSAGGVGGHLSSYASIATLYEVGMNHFFRAGSADSPGDMIYFQGHSAEGNYARAFLEGRLIREQLEKFRQETDGQGLSSYPHPWLMPDFWQFATVSLGLGPLQAIYQARFLKYLENRGLLAPSDRKVWVFAGDGEMDEVESVGALTVASREKLNNIIYVVNCNLQRLDGLVRGNGQIIQELEGVFRGAGWHVIKVLWDSHWDVLFEQDKTGRLVVRLSEILDGQLQHASVHGGAAMRELLSADDAELQALLSNYSDEDLARLGRGAHDPVKVYAAYQAAVQQEGPVVILAQGIKGHGVSSAEGRNIAHNQLEMSTDELKAFCERFGLALSDEQLQGPDYYLPDTNDPALQYLQERRKALNGWLPARSVPQNLSMPAVLPLSAFESVLKGSGERTASTTMVFSRILNILLKDGALGKHIVPIFSDEVRTFGMETLFRQIGIYSPSGQQYIPEDRDQLVYYHESTDGQLLEEGITEAGCMASFIAAATSSSVHHLPMIPFFTYYSMFGFQRVGDLIWAAGDMRARGFLIGATAGRTTLEGEGLQHQDGSSLLIASTFPTCRAYDPAFGYEMAVLIRKGLSDMVEQQKDVFYYITAMNEKYVQPPMPEDVEEGICRGMYLVREGREEGQKAQRVQLLGSGAILREVLAAADLLQQDFGVVADVWSVTSFGELRREGESALRARRFGKETGMPWIEVCLSGRAGPVIAATDYVRALPDLVRPYIGQSYTVLGTDGFGRSDTREKLRRFFEVDRFNIVIAALHALSEENGTVVTTDTVREAVKKYHVDADAPNPWDV